jgi:ATP-binding cassette subfamily F protein uup
MNILSLENVSKSFGIKPLIQAVTFGLDEKDKVGVIGANGSGKTTLLRLIAGAEKPDQGRVVITNNKTVAYLSQNPPSNPEHSVIEAVFAGNNETLQKQLSLLRDYETACHELAQSGGSEEKLLVRISDLQQQLEHTGAWQLETEAKAMLAALGITDLSAKMHTLSGGQRKRVALAHSLLIKPDLLILDEPTNHLDAETVEWLESYLAEHAGALLLVTHDRYFLDRVTNRIIEIDRGHAQSFAGNYADYLEKKQQQEAQQVVQAQKLKQTARRELEWLRRGPKARTTKAKARIDRAESLIQQARQAATTLAEKKELDIQFEPARLGSKTLALHHITKSYGERTLIADFSYQFKRGDRIGIIGANGAGKTTLLEIITERVKPDTGELEFGETVSVGYYDQESRALDDDKRLIDYVKEIAEVIRTAEGDTITASQMLDRFLFPPAMQYQPIASLSGGERRRLYLLRLLMSAPNLLLLDEITNDLDIPTLSALEEFLESFPGCLIVVSHDRYFLDRTTDTIFRFEGAGAIREYPGNYSAFLETRERELAEQSALQAATRIENKSRETGSPEAANSSDAGQKHKLSFKEKRELAELETRIAQNEARQIEIDRQLTENASDHVLVQQLYEEQQSIRETLNCDLERWTELAEFAE